MAFRRSTTPADVCDHSGDPVVELGRLRTPSPENTYFARYGVAPPPPAALLPSSMIWRQAMPFVVMVPMPMPTVPAMTPNLQEVPDANICSAVDTDKLIGFAKFGPGAQSDTCGDVSSEVSSLGSSHESLPDLELPEGVPSLGSLNHPHGCLGPCKYIKKAQGCKDGLSCLHCHLCVWRSRRDGKKKVNKFVSVQCDC